MTMEFNGTPVSINYYSDQDCEDFNRLNNAMDENDDLFYSGPGWYYATCCPGCLPDSDWFGPYDTEDACIEAAEEFYGD